MLTLARSRARAAQAARLAIRDVSDLLTSRRDAPRPALHPIPDRLPPPPAMEAFRDIPMVPVSSVRDRRMTHREKARRSGPVWPDFESQTWVRHSFGGRIVDRRPAPPARCRTVLERPCVWIGTAEPHFGHLIAEHLTRLLWSIYLRPQDTFVFQASSATRWLTLPRHFWDVLGWYGLPRAQVHLLARPTLARELRVAPQAEPLGGPGPDEAYLDLLRLHADRMGLAPVRSEFLYVSRAGMAGSGRGGHCGEGYLVERLAARGVRVLDPGTAPLRDQLALYAGAGTIIFAEGSAVHGRQLLGRLDQRIAVLNRRPGRRIAAAELAPRCAELHHIEAARALCVPVGRTRADVVARAVCFYDLDRTLEGLRELGLDLGPGWSATDYRASCEADVASWLRGIEAEPWFFDRDATVAALEAVPPGPVPDGSGPGPRGLSPSD